MCLSIDCKTVSLFRKISQDIGKAWRKSLTRAKRVRREKKSLSPVSLSVFILVPDLLFDCSRLLEYAKIRTFLQSSLSTVLNRLQMEELVNAVEQEVIITNILEPRYNEPPNNEVLGDHPQRLQPHVMENRK